MVTNACAVDFAARSWQVEDGVFVDLWNTIKFFQRAPSNPKAPQCILSPLPCIKTHSW